VILFSEFPKTLQPFEFVDRRFQLLKWPHCRDYCPNVFLSVQTAFLPMTNTGGWLILSWSEVDQKSEPCECRDVHKGRARLKHAID
jgi:hypothetical protein